MSPLLVLAVGLVWETMMAPVMGVGGQLCGGVRNRFVCDQQDPAVFHICLGNHRYTMNCPGTLHFNLRTQTCDWPLSAHCGEEARSQLTTSTLPPEPETELEPEVVAAGSEMLTTATRKKNISLNPFQPASLVKYKSEGTYSDTETNTGTRTHNHRSSHTGISGSPLKETERDSTKYEVKVFPSREQTADALMRNDETVQEVNKISKQLKSRPHTAESHAEDSYLTGNFQRQPHVFRSGFKKGSLPALSPYRRPWSATNYEELSSVPSKNDKSSNSLSKEQSSSPFANDKSRNTFDKEKSSKKFINEQSSSPFAKKQSASPFARTHSFTRETSSILVTNKPSSSPFVKKQTSSQLATQSSSSSTRTGRKTTTGLRTGGKTLYHSSSTKSDIEAAPKSSTLQTRSPFKPRTTSYYTPTVFRHTLPSAARLHQHHKHKYEDPWHEGKTFKNQNQGKEFPHTSDLSRHTHTHVTLPAQTRDDTRWASRTRVTPKVDHTLEDRTSHFTHRPSSWTPRTDPATDSTSSYRTKFMSSANPHSEETFARVDLTPGDAKTFPSNDYSFPRDKDSTVRDPAADQTRHSRLSPRTSLAKISPNVDQTVKGTTWWSTTRPGSSPSRTSPGVDFKSPEVTNPRRYSASNHHYHSSPSRLWSSQTTESSKRTPWWSTTYADQLKGRGGYSTTRKLPYRSSTDTDKPTYQNTDIYDTSRARTRRPGTNSPKTYRHGAYRTGASKPDTLRPVRYVQRPNYHTRVPAWEDNSVVSNRQTTYKSSVLKTPPNSPASKDVPDVEKTLKLHEPGGRVDSSFDLYQVNAPASEDRFALHQPSKEEGKDKEKSAAAPENQVFALHQKNVNQQKEETISVYKSPVEKYETKRGKCSSSWCKLPSCRCVGSDIPGDLEVKDVPQMVMLTFDDSINGQNIHYFRGLFNGTIKNPNGCTIKGTFYVSGDNSDFQMVRQMFKQGHEIASHTLSHRNPTNWWGSASYEDWQHEVQGMKERLHEKSGVPLADIRGMRAPFLQVGGDAQYAMLKENKFRYDSSMVTGSLYPGKKNPVWPFTLDTPPDSSTCTLTPCPTRSYPGLWEVPLVRWYGSNKIACAMPDACTTELGSAGARKFMEENFNRHYTSNRAPFGIFIHAAWFVRKEGIFQGLYEFLASLAEREDVWVVTVNQALDWIERPVRLGALSALESWDCGRPEM